MSETPPHHDDKRNHMDAPENEITNADETLTASKTGMMRVPPESPGVYPPYPPAYPPQQRRRGGCGCWIPVLLATFVATLLVIAGLFLPPINLYDRLFGTQYEFLNAQQNAIAADGLTLVLDPADTGREFGVALDSVALENFISGSTQSPDWVPLVRSAVPPYLALQSPVYDLQTTGIAPKAVTFDIQTGGLKSDLLDVYGWRTQTGRWEFLPSQPNTAGNLTVSIEGDIPQRIALFQSSVFDPQIIVPVDVVYELTSDAAQVASIVSPAGLQPNLRGELVGSLAPGFNVNASYRVMPVIRNFLDDAHVLDIDTVQTIVGNRSLRAAHIQQITGVAVNGGYDGVFIDYRSLPVEQRSNFSAFMAELKTAFRDHNLLLGVVVPAAENKDGVWDTGAYDWRALGANADYVQVNFNPNPATFAPGEDRLVEAMLRWAVGEVSRYKLVAGVTALSLREVNGEFTTLGYEEALSGLGNVTITGEKSAAGTVNPGAQIVASLDGYDALPGLDTLSNTPFIDYTTADGAPVSRVWLTTADALRFRLDRFANFAVGGVALNDLVDNDLADRVLETVLNYKLQLPTAPSTNELALRWRIENANGTVSDVITSLNDDLVVTLEAEGNFAVNVEIIEGNFSSIRSGAAVAVFAPTLTPTPLPTSTPTPLPTVTPTLETIIPTSTPNPAGGNVGNVGSQPPGVNPGPGSIAGGFEYGGHVTSASSEVAASAMRRAGMTWMKVQVRYGPGADAGGAVTQINEAKSRGFKVLVGTVGSPSDLRAGGGGFIQQYASWLGQIAAAGPDAIEVWNEPNIDREWPEGQISGANYTAMLGAAYSAIKQANPSVMVISGALAPTGAEAAYPGKVVNDDNFLAQMMAAGAINYMDCVGVHYNEGIVSPRQVSGDPRDNYYSRYYQTMENLYWNATGGAKPLCFTELGYLTPEGYGGLSDFWGWGRGTTVQQQAAWLADAIAIASRSGRVRLLIVWNVDFSSYDANDPQGGYAMVRPGGGCPACDAIAAAR